MAADGGWGWMVVVGCCVCHFFLIGVNRSMGIVFVLLRERFDASATDTALAASIFVSVRAFGGPIGSKLSEKFSCRTVTITGALLLCVGFILCSFATRLLHVYLALGVVAGAGGTLVFSPSYVAVSQWFDKKKGKAMALSTLGTGFGSVCMAPLITMLIDQYNYFGTMLIVAALLLNNAVGGALYRTPPPPALPQQQIYTVETEDPAAAERQPSEDEDFSPIESSASPTAAAEDKTKMQITDVTTSSSDGNVHDDLLSDSQMTAGTTQTPKMRMDVATGNSDAVGVRKCLRVLRSSLWTNIPFIAYCVIVAAVQGCIQSLLIFLPARGRELGAGPSAAALLLTLFGAFDMGGRFVFGFIFDVRAVRRRRTFLYTLVAACFGAGTALLAAAGGFLLLAVLTCLVAVLEGGAHSQRTSCVTEMVEPAQMALSVGLVIFAQGFGNFYGPLVGGVLKDKTGSYASCFVFGGTTLLSVCVLMTVVNLVKCRRHPASVENHDR